LLYLWHTGKIADEKFGEPFFSLGLRYKHRFKQMKYKEVKILPNCENKKFARRKLEHLEEMRLVSGFCRGCSTELNINLE
jgi:hypothetical protein